MAGKFYGVRKGKTVGVVTTWAECQDMTKGVSGAEFKSFPTEEEALAYVRGEDSFSVSLEAVKIKRPDREDVANLYTISKEDGEGMMAVGIVIETMSKMYSFYGEIDSSNFKSLRGLAGKLLSVMAGVQLCADMGLKFVNIINSYEGVEKWYTGAWQAKGVLQSHYASQLNGIRFGRQMEYKFIQAPDKCQAKGYVLAGRMVSRAKNMRHYINVDTLMRGALTVKDVPMYSVS